jgi:hypothetical protein
VQETEADVNVVVEGWMEVEGKSVEWRVVEGLQITSLSNKYSHHIPSIHSIPSIPSTIRYKHYTIREKGR